MSGVAATRDVAGRRWRGTSKVSRRCYSLAMARIDARYAARTRPILLVSIQPRSAGIREAWTDIAVPLLLLMVVMSSRGI